MRNEFNYMRLYTLNQLTQFGINEKELRSWVEAGWLEPFTYSGNRPKYRYADFQQACSRSKQAREESRKASPSNRRREFKAAEDFYSQLTNKFKN